jgi:hypothetical protein
MAIGLSNVETRKVKKPSAKKAESRKPDTARPVAKSRMATTLIENSAKVMNTLSSAPAAQAAPLKERKERSASSGELNSLWLDWSNRVAGVQPESLPLLFARQWMELERFVFDLVKENVLRELRKTAFGVKVVSRIDRYRK